MSVTQYETEQRKLSSDSNLLIPTESLQQSSQDLVLALQTTLDLNVLFQLFSAHLAEQIGYSGLHYICPEHDENWQTGYQALHKCTYSLSIHDQHLGELVIYRRRKFDANILENLEKMLAHLLCPLRNVLLHRKALNSAHIDPLTRVRNRRSLMPRLEQALSAAKRHNRPMGLAIIDIDHFKRVNDQFGHLVGDEVLINVAQDIRLCVREADEVFRYGGEEFMILLPDTGVDGLWQMAERIRITISRGEQVSLPEDTQITTSVGAACWEHGESIVDWIARTDEALYEAKHAGRNITRLAKFPDHPVATDERDC